MSSKISKDLIYAAFFFIDIVGLSNPILSTETQKTKIKVLSELVAKCKTFVDISREKLLVLPTGDGMLIGFINGLEQPLKLAIEFHKKIADYNRTATSVEKIETRIGCHVGHVFVVKDILGNLNLWGPGAIISRRIMDVGDANHILLSNELANDLIEISKHYEKILHPLHNFGIKHGDDLLIFSVYGEGFGNSDLPKTKIKVKQKILNAEKNTKFEKIIFNIILKEVNSIHVERYFYFSNTSSEPIYEIIVGIVVNSEEEFQNLNLIVHDEKNDELKISKIFASTPFSKKIVIKLAKPIFNGDSGRMVKITYDVQLSKNCFENFFLIDTSNFELNFSYHSNVKYTPMLYYIDYENESKSRIEQLAQTIAGISSTIKWEKIQGINAKDMIRLEW
ncbi:MAG: hypothetical protein OEL69_07545 [Nitrosopumilus sp.]|nr:hypothetical protein [Nitrosopumilus sp.]